MSLMASPKPPAVKEPSAVYEYGISGNLQKRQRGRGHFRDPDNTTTLKFQQRYCILKKDDFTYMTTERVS